jgi:hypothetical protein
MRYPWFYGTKAEADASQEQIIERSNKALKVVDRIGGQCLPTLLRRFQSRDSPLKTQFAQWAVRMHLIPASWTPRTSAIVRGQALTAIVKLDYSAKPIFPALARLAHDKDPDIKAAAKYALIRINPAEFTRLERLQSGKR